MNVRVTKLLVLAVAFGWMTQSLAQTDVDNSTFARNDNTSGSLVCSEDRYPVDRATFFRKLVWGLTVATNTDGEYKLVPLFGYLSSTLKEDKTLDWKKLDADIKNGEVRLVILEPKSAGKKGYLGQGIIVAKPEKIKREKHFQDAINSTGPTSNSAEATRLSANNIEKLLTEFDTLDSSDRAVFAFTRPLAGIAHEEEFIGGSNLWRASN